MSKIQEPERPEPPTYDLDLVEGEPGEGIEEESERPNKSSTALGQPLPRLWKAEPDPSDEPEEMNPDQAAKKAKGGHEDKPAPKKASKPKAKGKPFWEKAKRKSTGEGDGNEKKVLVEDTPTFDTVEARQRARLIVGGLGVFCVMLACYIGYSILFRGSSEVDLPSADPLLAQSAPAPRPSLDHEARFMLKRAEEFAKGGRTDQAIGMLKRVVASYKGTQSATEARAALDRPNRNLPLFPDGPTLLAERERLEHPPTQGTAPVLNPGPPQAATGPIAMAPAQTQPYQSQPPPVQTPPAQTLPTQPPPAQTQQPVPSQPVAQTQATQPPPVQTQATQPPPVQMQPAQSPPAQTQAALPPPVRMQPAQSPPAQAQQAVPSQPVVQTQPAGTQPAQSMPPSGPGQVAMIVPVDPRGHAEMPRPVEKPDAGKVDIIPRKLTERMLPPGFKAKFEAGYHESGWPLIIVGDRDGGPMVLVPGGSFTMGNDRGEPVEAPAHTVRLSTFYIDQFEVTTRQFRTFLDESHYRGVPPIKWHSEEKLRDSPAGAPATYVTWRDAETYAIWAGKRLPTEAQWEMAARSTDGRRYPWGDQPIKWSRPREFRQVDPVMSFQEDVSVYGVYDMAGNVMEWTRDWYEPNYFVKLRDKVVENPTGPVSKRQNSIQRVVKGGSKNWTVSARQGVDVDKRLPYLGFRCSLAVEGPEAAAGIAPHPVKPADQPGTPPPGAGPPAGNVPF